jgi:hypothetical protein
MGQRLAFFVIGLCTAVVNWLIGEPWWAAIIMGVAVVTFGELASRAIAIKLRPRPAPVPPQRLHGRNNDIAMHVGHGLTNHQIATEMAMSDAEVSRRVDNICRTLRLPNRSALSGWAREQLHPHEPGKPAPTQRHRQRWEWVAEVGTGIAVMALGLGALALPPNTPYVGTPSWVGLSVVAFGLAVCVLSTSTYAWELTRRGDTSDSGTETKGRVDPLAGSNPQPR